MHLPMLSPRVGGTGYPRGYWLFGGKFVKFPCIRIAFLVKILLFWSKFLGKYRVLKYRIKIKFKQCKKPCILVLEPSVILLVKRIKIKALFPHTQLRLYTNVSLWHCFHVLQKWSQDFVSITLLSVVSWPCSWGTESDVIELVLVGNHPFWKW